MTGKQVLITGGAGFIGSHLADLLDSESINYRILDNLSGGFLENIPSAVNKNLFIKGDVGDAELMEQLICSSSLVIHLASVVGVMNVLNNPLETINTNINSLNSIARSCAINNVPLVFFSSSLVYPVSVSNKSRFSESEEIYPLGFNPVSLYVYAKVTGELICEYYKELLNLRYIIIRPFNMIGIRQRPESGMVVPSFIHSALVNKEIYVYGNGKQVRSFSDVKTAVNLLWEIVNLRKSYGQIFNLATTEKGISIADLAGLICYVLKEPVKINFIPYKEVYCKSYRDIEFRIPSLAKLRNYLPPWEERELKDILTEILEYESKPFLYKK